MQLHLTERAAKLAALSFMVQHQTQQPGSRPRKVEL
jgi:hypothetical protein